MTGNAIPSRVATAVRWYRKKVPTASVERCVDAYENALASSRMAKQRRKRDCIRGCGRLVSWDADVKTSGRCIACYESERPRAQHGTISKYHAGCRCEECRAAHAAYAREWYRRNRRFSA